MVEIGRAYEHAQLRLGDPFDDPKKLQASNREQRSGVGVG
jgi:hypothetical protein